MEIRKINSEETLEIRHRVLWPTKTLDFVRLDDDDDGLHYGGFLEDKLISVASIFIKDGSARLRKFATLEEYQGKGYGSQILNYILDDLSNSGQPHGKSATGIKPTVTHFWADARLSAEGFYNRFGMKKSGDVFYKSDVKYVVMERKL